MMEAAMRMDKQSLVTRITVGKCVGCFIGFVGFFALPFIVPEIDSFVRWGVLLWYTTMGAVIGVFDVFTEHPILRLPMPWWFWPPVLGAWMNFVLTFFAYDTMAAVMKETFGENGLMQFPFWFTAEGAIIGLIIGYFATRLGGEGKATVGK